MNKVYGTSNFSKMTDEEILLPLVVLGLGVNPFPSRFIYRTPPLRDSAHSLL